MLGFVTQFVYKPKLRLSKDFGHKEVLPEEISQYVASICLLDLCSSNPAPVQQSRPVKVMDNADDSDVVTITGPVGEQVRN